VHGEKRSERWNERPTQVEARSFSPLLANLIPHSSHGSMVYEAPTEGSNIDFTEQQGVLIPQWHNGTVIMAIVEHRTVGQTFLYQNFIKLLPIVSPILGGCKNLLAFP
jgi:hypothetical protein